MERRKEGRMDELDSIPPNGQMERRKEGRMDELDSTPPSPTFVG